MVIKKFDLFMNEKVNVQQGEDSTFDIEEVLNSYLGTMLWSSGDEYDEYSVDDFNVEDKEKSRKDVKFFINEIISNPDAYGESSDYDDSTLGHNLALSRNGHGAGFFDDNNDILQDIARKMGQVTLEIGDDGQLYIFGGKQNESKVNESSSEYEDLIPYTIPQWAVSPLINGDRSALTDDEEETLDKFVDGVIKQNGNAHFMLPSSEEELEPEFQPKNDIDGWVGDDVITLYIRPDNDMNESKREEISLEAKYKKGDVVNYLPKISGLKKDKKFTINHVGYKESDELSKSFGVEYKPSFVYSFEDTSLTAIEDDIKLAK